MPKKFVGIPSIFQKVWGNRNNLFIIEAITYFRQKFSISQCGNTSWAFRKCFRKFRLSKNLCMIGVSQLFVEIFLSLSAEKIRGHPFLVPESLRYRKFYCIIGVSNFSVEIFLSHLAEKFCKRIPLFLREFLVSKSFAEEKWGYHIFPSRNFGLTEARNFMSIPAMFLEKLWYRKFGCIVGGITFSVKNFRSHSAEEIRGHPFNISESLE